MKKQIVTLAILLASLNVDAKLCWNPVAGGLPVLTFEGKPTATLGGKVSAIKPCLKPIGLRPEDTPEKASCLNGALTVCDAKYSGMRLFINPLPNTERPCRMWIVVPVPPVNPNDIFTYTIKTYEGTRVRPDGTRYCPGD